VAKVTDNNYILKAEGNGAIACEPACKIERTVGRTGRKSLGCLPTYASRYQKHFGRKEVQCVKQFKICSRGRNGFKRAPESDLTPAVVTAYLRIMNERRDKEPEDN
jgi:hypothetical protein